MVPVIKGETRFDQICRDENYDRRKNRSAEINHCDGVAEKCLKEELGCDLGFNTGTEYI